MLALSTKMHAESQLSLEHLVEEIYSNQMVRFVIRQVQLILCGQSKIKLNQESSTSLINLP